MGGAVHGAAKEHRADEMLKCTCATAGLPWRPHKLRPCEENGRHEMGKQLQKGTDVLASSSLQASADLDMDASRLSRGYAPNGIHHAAQGTDLRSPRRPLGHHARKPRGVILCLVWGPHDSRAGMRGDDGGAAEEQVLQLRTASCYSLRTHNILSKP